MPETTTEGTLEQRVRSIQQRMQHVSEEELLLALGTTTTAVAATTSKTMLQSAEMRERFASASTQTAS